METQNFFKAGGALDIDSPSYIRRGADEELYKALLAGEYCYILTSRQMGKSSVIKPVAQRLNEVGIKTIKIDLTGIGTDAGEMTPERWHYILAKKISKALGVPDAIKKCWKVNRDEGEALIPRWSLLLQTLLIVAAKEHGIVIFLDELDTVRKLPFSTDDFFAGIRAFYEQRDAMPIFKKLRFCLVGVSTPDTLIQDPRISPFNIGQSIRLEDFTLEQIQPWTKGLNREDKVAEELLKRVFEWTNGQPYLTQLLCKKIVEQDIYTCKQLDEHCKQLFWNPDKENLGDDNHLGNVFRVFKDEEICNEECQSAALTLYEKIWRGKRIKYDATHPAQQTLYLAGLIKSVNGRLQVRNRIYEKVFSQGWVKGNMPEAEKIRQQDARQRGFMQASLAASIVIGLMSYGGYWVWDTEFREIVTYCDSHTKRFGIMECVGKLEPGEEKGRAIVYKFIQKGRDNTIWKVQAVGGNQGETHLYAFNDPTQKPVEEYLNPKHTVYDYFKTDYSHWNDSPLREVQWEFALGEDGKIVYERAYDRFNNLVKGIVYAPSNDEFTAKAHYVGANGYPIPPAGSEAEYIEIDYTVEENGRKAGYEKEIRFYDNQNKPRSLSVDDNIHIKKRELNEDGLIIKESFFDENNMPTNNEFGIHSIKIKYGTNNKIESHLFFDENGKAIGLAEGYHEISYSYYPLTENLQSISFFDINKQKTGSGHKDVHKIEYQYDQQGNLLEVANFNSENKPILGSSSSKNNLLGVSNPDMMNSELLFKSRDSYYRVKNKYETNYLTEISFFGVDNQKIDLNGLHILKIDYDSVGNRIRESYFDSEGNKTVRSDGSRTAHRIDIKYLDFKNKIIERSFFDIDGNPVAGIGNAFKVKEKINNHATYDEQSYFDVEGNPILMEGQGVHKILSHYDSRGQRIGQSLFDTDNKPTVALNLGSHKTLLKEYVKDGWDYAEESYFDTNGNPARRADLAIHKMVIKRSKTESVQEFAYFDEHGNPMEDNDGFHRARQEPVGMPGIETHWNAKGEKIHERKGLTRRVFYHGDDAKEKGCDILVYTADSTKLLSPDLSWEEMKITPKEVYMNCFDINNQPIKFTSPANFKGAHQINTLQLEDGNFIEMSVFGISGEPINSKGWGTHKLKLNYIDTENIVERTYLDEANQPTYGPNGIHEVIERQDNRGNSIEATYFDVEGQAILDNNGVHQFKQAFDENNRVIRESYFDTEQQATLNINGIHAVTYQYANATQTKASEEAYFDTQGQPTFSKWGVHKTKYRHDAQGNVIELAYFDPQDQPASNKYGIHKQIKTYREENQLDDVFFYDVKGKQVLVEVLVTDIIPNGQAEALGIQVGDIFTHYDSKPVEDTDSFMAYHQDEKDTDQPKTLIVQRGDETLKFSIKAGKIGIYFQNKQQFRTP